MKKYAEGICFKKIFIIFIIGSIIGVIWEGSFIFLKMYFNHEVPIWYTFKGVIWGPFSPAYGFGASIMTLLLCQKKRPWWQTFLYGMLIGGCLEYALSFLQEAFVGSTSWDYSQKFLNINGRTTIPYMFIWGLLCLVYVKYIYPFLSNLIEKIPPKIGNPLFKIILIITIIDCTISWTALYRQMERRHDIPPHTRIGKYYDEYLNDEVLKKSFVNMELDK